MRRRVPKLKGKTQQKRGPKPKQATQDRYLAIAKYVYRHLGAQYPMESAVQAARKTYGFSGKMLSRKTVYKAVAKAEVAHREELERTRAEYDPYSDPPPDTDPELARIWRAEKQLWTSMREKFRAGEISHEPKMIIKDISSYEPSPRKLAIMEYACPKCGQRSKTNIGQGWFCSSCECALDIPIPRIRWEK